MRHLLIHVLRIYLLISIIRGRKTLVQPARYCLGINISFFTSTHAIRSTNIFLTFHINKTTSIQQVNIFSYSFTPPLRWQCTKNARHSLNCTKIPPICSRSVLWLQTISSKHLNRIVVP